MSLNKKKQPPVEIIATAKPLHHPKLPTELQNAKNLIQLEKI
jgi:hypothetical protein